MYKNELLLFSYNYNNDCNVCFGLYIWSVGVMNKDKQICDRCYKECFNYDEIKSKSYKRIICNECKEIEKMLLLKGIISDLIDLKIKLPKKFVFYSNNEFQGIKDIYACGEHDGSDDQVFATEEESNAICDIMNKLEDLFFIVKEYF